MDKQRELELNLVGDIYDAALSSALWASVIEKLAALVRAEKANVLAFDRLNPDYFLFYSHGTTPEQLARYHAGGFADLDLEFSGRWIEAAGGLERVVANHDSFGSLDNYKRAAGRLHSEFFGTIGIDYQGGALLEKTDYRWAVLGLHRSEAGGTDGFEPETLAIGTRLMPHLRRALQIHRQLIVANQKHARLYRLLDSLATGVLLLDANAGMRYANPAAELLLRQHDGLQLGPRHSLKARDGARDAELRALVAGTVSVSHREATDAASGGVLALPDGSGAGQLMLTVVPLSEMAGYAELGSDAVTTAIFLTDPQGRHHLATRLLKDGYGLSERERQVCEAFVNSGTLEGVASECGLALSSVRTYLKDIYAKTGQRSQPELMQLLMGLRIDFEHIR